MRRRIGWTCGCWQGYPNRWYKRLAVVRWAADRWDPFCDPDWSERAW